MHPLLISEFYLATCNLMPSCEAASSSWLICFHLYFLHSLFKFPFVDVIIKFTVISFSFCVLFFFFMPIICVTCHIGVQTLSGLTIAMMPFILCFPTESTIWPLIRLLFRAFLRIERNSSFFFFFLNLPEAFNHNPVGFAVLKDWG